jgi:hypothetical protein
LARDDFDDDFFLYNDEDIRKVQIVIHGKLSAEQLGKLIVSVSKMYGVMQDYFGSEHELELKSIKPGSHYLEFLANIQVWNSMVYVWKTMHTQMLVDLGAFIGTNLTWDMMKEAFKHATTKKQFTRTETKTFFEHVQECQTIAAAFGANLEVDFAKEKVIFDNSYVRHPDYVAGIEITQSVLEDTLGSLPPRRLKHKKKY